MHERRSWRCRTASNAGGLLVLAALFLAAAFAPARAVAQGQPAAPSNPVATDHTWDKGEKLDLTWALSPDDGTGVMSYRIYRTSVSALVDAADPDVAFERVAEVEADVDSHEVSQPDPEETYVFVVVATRADGDAIVVHQGTDAGETVDLSWDAPPDDEIEVTSYQIYRQRLSEMLAVLPDVSFDFVDQVDAGVSEFTVNELDPHETYFFQVSAVGLDGRSESALVTTPAGVSPTMQLFDKERRYLALITLMICGAVVYWIYHARQGRPIKVRKIAGLEAVDEAVGRATEMGRSCLYVPGIQDINEIQTIASMTVLARVSKTAAEYDAKVEVPTSKSLVMTTARETVQAAYLAAGRPDAYNQDLIYYVTDEQFGYVAYLQGMMVREKPAACFYMGAFFAESLILAETGNSIGAIQVAGTAMPAQLPFFVAACDYTLIGEEFFAASAYLSGSAEEMGSLKGQDVGKVIVAVLLSIGLGLATVASVTGSATIASWVEYLKFTILT